MTGRKWVKWVLLATVVVVVLVLNHAKVQEDIRKGPGSGRLRPSHWEVFSPRDGGFAVEMPRSPKRKTAHKTDWGINYEVLTHTASDAGMAFTVAYYDRPSDPMVNWSAAALFDNFRENMYTAHEGDDVREELVLFCQKTALRVRVLGNKEQRVGEYLFLPVGSRCYMLIVGGADSLWQDSLAERFITSFELQESTATSRGAS